MLNMLAECLSKRKEEGKATVQLSVLGDDLRVMFEKSVTDLTRAGKRRGIGEAFSPVLLHFDA